MAISGVQSHVKRIQNPDNPTWFVDIERIDFFLLTTGSGPDYQRFGVTLKWMDEGVKDGGTDANPARAMTKVRLTLDPKDPSAPFVDIPIVAFYASIAPQGQQTQGHLLANADDNLSRAWIGADDDVSGNPNFGSITNAITNSEDKLNAGTNVASDAYEIKTYLLGQFAKVDYLVFFVTNTTGKRVGTSMPVTELVKRLIRPDAP